MRNSAKGAVVLLLLFALAGALDGGIARPTLSETAPHPRIPLAQALASQDVSLLSPGGGGWTLRNPTIAPPPQDLHAAAYDSLSDRLVTFGGDTGAVLLSDATWSYDLNTNLWSEMTPTTKPPARWSHSMAYDVESDRIILFGGDVTRGVAGHSNDTWVYDFDSNTWEETTSPVKPSGRIRPAMVYDAESDRAVLFGGLSRGDLSNETWAYDFNADAWAKIPPVGPVPSPRYRHSMAYDSASDRVILFGGAAVDGVRDDTWAYDLNTNTWTEMNASVRPSSRSGHGMVYDAESDRTVLFGGGNGPYENDTWVYDYNNNTWTKMNHGARPSGRQLQAMAYAQASDAVILFGGFTNEGGRNAETWTYHHAPSPPSEPQGLNATAVHAAVNLAWNQPSSDGEAALTGYRIYRGTSSASLALLTALPNVREYEDSGLENCLTYSYEVSAINGIGEGPRSRISATPQETPCAPGNLRAEVDGGLVSLLWWPPPVFGAPVVLGYRIYRGAGPGELILLAEVGGTLNYTDSAPDGYSYSYAVAAVNALGEGARTNAVMIALPDVTGPRITITSPLPGATLTTASVMVSGTASDNVAVERVELSSDGLGWVLANGSASWSGTLPLLSGSNPIFVRATDSSGNAAVVNITVTVTPSFGIDAATFLVVVILAAAAAALALFLLRRREK